MWKVQVGKDEGSYWPRYEFDNENQAILWYNGINIGNGYKKRLVDPDGKTVARVLS